MNCRHNAKGKTPFVDNNRMIDKIVYTTREKYRMPPVSRESKTTSNMYHNLHPSIRVPTNIDVVMIYCTIYNDVYYIIE